MIQFAQYFSSGLKPPTRISWYHMISIDAMHSHLWVKSSQLGVRWLQRHFLCCFKILTCQLSKSHRKKHVSVGMFCSMGICSSFLEWQVFSHDIFLQLTSRMSTKRHPTRHSKESLHSRNDHQQILYAAYPDGCFLKWWYPQNTPKWSFLVGKPMVVGYHHFRKPPDIVLHIFSFNFVAVWKTDPDDFSRPNRPMGLGTSLFICWRLIPKKSGEGGHQDLDLMMLAVLEMEFGGWDFGGFKPLNTASRCCFSCEFCPWKRNSEHKMKWFNKFVQHRA